MTASMLTGAPRAEAAWDKNAASEKLPNRKRMESVHGEVLG